MLTSEKYAINEHFHPKAWQEEKQWCAPFFNALGEKFEARHIDIAREYSLKKANLWLLNYEPLVKSDIAFTASDEEFKDWAESKAADCRAIALRCSVADTWKLCSEKVKAYDIEPLSVKGRGGICYKFQLDGIIERYKDPAWWLRQIRKVSIREIEKIALAMGEVNKKGVAYCSNYVVKRRSQQKARNRALLENLKAVNNEGDEYSLQELSDLSVANPVIRRHELMARLNGFERIAALYGHGALFFTITCPSRFHPSSDKYDGATPREAQRYLSWVWSKVRSKLGRENIRPFGFRIAEPHKDGCPHWHMLLFVNPENSEKLQAVIKHYALQVDGSEAGALKNRVDVKEINLETGSAVGYISKYICKNIDGVFSDKLENYQGDMLLEIQSASDRVDVAFNCVDVDGNYIGRSDDAAIRVEAWASAWGIRQFQQVGGPSVTVWRELRRMDTEEEEFDLFGGVVERARKAADSGDWAAFCIAMGAVDAPRKGHNIQALMFVPHEIDKSTGEVICSAFGIANKYGEPSKGVVLGVTALNIDYLTRFFEWDIRDTRVVEVMTVTKPNWEYLLGCAAPPKASEARQLGLV